MSNVFKFPDRVAQRREENPYTAKKMLAGMPASDLYELVFEKNFHLLELDESDEIVHAIEFFTNEDYPNRVLADIGVPHLRGLYSVELDGYSLLKLADEPLVHFK